MNLAVSWNPAYETGIDIIDRQHMRLFECLEEVNHAIDGGDPSLVEQVIRQLIDFCASHNDFEEQLLAEAGYPLLEPHRRQHEAFRVRAHSYSLQLCHGDDPMRIARDIRTDLAIWVTNHFQHEDLHYVPWVKRHLHPSFMERMCDRLFHNRAHHSL